MLHELRITDLALIEDLRLEFGPGLNVVTGETGAGKSLLQRALALAAGHRAGSEVVRRDAETARIAAVFDLPGDAARAARLTEIGVATEPGCRLEVVRTVARSGRGQVQLNGKTVALANLLEVGGDLVHLQGQHESLRLAQPETHLAMLDQAGGTGDLARRYREAFSHAGRLVDRLEALERGAAEIERRLEIARFDLDELARAGFADPNEDAALERERTRLRNAGRLVGLAEELLERLHGADGAALSAVESAARRLAESVTLDPALEPIAAALAEAVAPLDDGVRSLRAYAEDLAADPGRLEEIEERLVLIARLARKHRVESVAGLVARRVELEAEVERSDRDVAHPEELRAELERAADAAWKFAVELAAARRAASICLEAAMDAELAELGMPGARFSVRAEDLPAGPARGPAAPLTREGVGLGPDGSERIEFDLAANPGEGARPLARVASGGELSRIMLALRHVAGGSEVPTLVFDEVDAGIGGAAAEVVGRRLQSLARGAQVICITHLAQIAAFADRHYAVAKDAAGGRTRTAVTLVEGDDRVRELARMLAGSASEAGLRHAAELLESSRAAAVADGADPVAAAGAATVAGPARKPGARRRTRGATAGGGGKS